ncbi:MAG: hypothetical protein ACREMH_01180 [Gemmatimonadales bacterium]
MAFLLVVLPARAASQGYQPSPKGLPIELKATPAKALPGGRVTFSGETGRAGTRPVVLVVVPPGGAAAESLRAVPGSGGAFTATYQVPKRLGTYRVNATAPDGKGKTTTTFAAVAAAAVPASVASAGRAVVTSTTKAVDAVRASLASQPASPARDAALAKLTPVEEKLADAPKAIATLRTEMTKVFEARAKVAGPIPDWDQYQAELDQWEDEARRAAADLSKLAARSKAGAERCAAMDDQIETLTAASETMSLLTAVTDKTVGFWTDKIPGGLVARSTDPKQVTSGEQFALVQTMKLSASVLTGGGMGLVGAMPGLILDVIQYLKKEAFDRYCEKFEGPLTITYVAEAFTRSGEPMFDYTTRIDGRLLLLYPKGASGDAISLRGYVEGAGRFKVGGNPAPISRLAPGPTLYFTTKSPPGGRYWSELGRPNQALLPHTFRIPVEGILAGDSIVLNLRAADHDFGPLIQGKLVWVIMPTGGLWPEVVAPTFRLQRAHPIIERALRKRPVLQVLQGPNGLLAEGTFVRDSSQPSGTARARTRMTIQACNPGCLPLPLQPGSGR